RLHQILWHKLSLRLDELVKLSVRSFFVAQGFAAALDGDRVDAVQLEQAFLLLRVRRRALVRRSIEVPIDRQKQEKQGSEDNCRADTHTKNLLRTKTRVAIANRMMVSRPAPRLRSRCDCPAVTKKPAVSPRFSRSRLAIKRSSPARALIALT